MTHTLPSLLLALVAAADPSVAADAEREPTLQTNVLGLDIEAPLSTRGRVEVTSPYAVDAAGNRMSALPGALGIVRAGIGAKTGWFLHPFGVKAALEVDALGSLVNAPDLRASGLPYDNAADLQLRKAYVGFGAAYFASLAVGAMTSHWGLGLLANDGTHGWKPGNASFTDPVGGDRMLRAAVTSGPWPEFWGLKLAVAGDRVLGDDTTLFGDEVYQAAIALSLGEGFDHGGGVYAVRRHADTLSGARTDVWIVDGTARTQLQALSFLRLYAEAEGAFIFGDTTMGPSTTYPVHDVMQLGAVARAGADLGSFGFVADAMYASGDQNLDDRSQNAFRADPNLQQGMFLFRHLLASQTGRGVATASDPDLTGRPARDIERFATRGSVTNALVFFPRAWWRPVASLEIYGGPMLAMSEVPVVDPRNTRLNGGVAKNAVGSQPGAFLGTELDVGVRWRADLGPVEALVGAEGGALLPGDALSPSATFAPVYGTRMLLELRL